MLKLAKLISALQFYARKFILVNKALDASQLNSIFDGDSHVFWTKKFEKFRKVH